MGADYPSIIASYGLHIVMESAKKGTPKGPSARIGVRRILQYDELRIGNKSYGDEGAVDKQFATCGI